MSNKLKYKEETVRIVNYNDLDKFISTHYAQEFECVPDQCWGNDESHEITVEREELDDYQLERLEKFKATGYTSYMLHTLLKDMANNNVIEPGDYVISVSW